MKRMLIWGLLLVVGPVLAEAAWQEEWDQVVKAAKQEGKVAVLGPRQVQARDALTGPFEKKYGIRVDYLGGSGRELAPRVAMERRAGRYLWDVYVGGTSTGLFSFIPMGALDLLEPALIFPDNKDPKLWRDGELEFADRGRRQLVIATQHRGTIFINTDLVKPQEFKSHRDLLNPKWKGKMGSDDPRTGGPGRATFDFFHLHPALGNEFIRALAKQEITLLKDYAQQIDALGQGRYPIVIGTSDATAEYRMKQGVKIGIIDPRQLKEGTDLNPGNGAMALINRPAHPNAAKVYINWLLSKEGQTTFVRPMGYVSRRLDVPTDHVPEWRIPIPGSIKTYTQTSLEASERLRPFLLEVLGR